MKHMYPRSIINRDKFRDKFREFLWAYHEREKFLKSIESMRYCDWVIHKKLLEERGNLVYTIIGRGNGKWATIDRYLDLLLEGKDVVVTQPRGGYRYDYKRFKEIVTDRDLWLPRLETERDKYINDLLKKHTDDSIRKIFMTTTGDNFNWKPIVRHDDHIYFYEQYAIDPFCALTPNGMVNLEVSDNESG